MDVADYTQRLERAVKRAKSLEELEAPLPPDTVSIVFTTEIIQPTRLVRVPITEEEEDGAELPEGNWTVAPPRARFLSAVMDSPERVQTDDAAQDEYTRSVGEAIGIMTFADISDVQLGPEITCEDFVRNTSQCEHSLFRHAAFDVANQLSNTQQVGADNLDEDGRPADGQHLVKAVWLEPSMFSVYVDRPIEDAANYARTVDYMGSILSGLAMMRGGERGPQNRDDEMDDDGAESEDEGVWGAYREYDSASMLE
ncbi:hypothetical protein L202_07700 [Cryptococcus amylolentus CBS 6039]|uniref:Uncharacterized protein n=2 Tax=Cryptococcus amylolentus TaxID=104669 RepID=A0A1E3HA06_9TREE|nr:hypothetical protein L202_07700 [Cryptococcus amylolentus CBS 6039]ODN73134.1 hypothetical protein L202_07700 [Cryptococcus amylolentus CBS 6039]ODN98965.1 hypothetical protein I350_07114 [Cryptococcus amylolentus CBS 6273]